MDSSAVYFPDSAGSAHPQPLRSLPKFRLAVTTPCTNSTIQNVPPLFSLIPRHTSFCPGSSAISSLNYEIAALHSNGPWNIVQLRGLPPGFFPYMNNGAKRVGIETDPLNAWSQDPTPNLLDLCTDQAFTMLQKLHPELQTADLLRLDAIPVKGAGVKIES